MTCLNPGRGGGGGGGGGHSGILILSNIEAWPIFFLADLQKWMVGLCSL